MAKVRKISLSNCLVLGLVQLLCSYSAKAQNLVPDPGFEKLDHCPDKGFKNQSTLKALSYWWCPNKTSPDCMSKCAGGMDGLINNVGGTQEPYEGNSYVGICHGRKGRYYEFVQTQLTEKLVAGKTYLITLHISFGDKVFYATNEIGVCLSAEKISEKSKGVMKVPAYVPVRTGNYYTDKQNWTKLKALYMAGGGEAYLTIGYFNPYLELQLVGGKKPKAIDGEADDVYYFIDDVSVEEVELGGKDMSLVPISREIAFAAPEKNKWFSIKELQFINGETKFLPGSEPELDKLSQLLLSDSSLKLEIGFRAEPWMTGKEADRIHGGRCRSVYLYMISKGINPKRVVLIEGIYSRPPDPKGSNDGIEFKWN